METLSIVALLHGPDRPGLVAQVAGWIFEQGGNILHADQHRDAEENVFFQRVEWSQPGAARGRPPDRGRLRSDGPSRTRHELPNHRFKPTDHVSECWFPRFRIVSRTSLCGFDEVKCAVNWFAWFRTIRIFATFASPWICLSSHRRAARSQDRGRGDATWRFSKNTKVDLIVLARYMQILSGRFLVEAGVPIINIHHSFLPAFAGGRPTIRLTREESR